MPQGASESMWAIRRALHEYFTLYKTYNVRNQPNRRHPSSKVAHPPKAGPGLRSQALPQLARLGSSLLIAGYGR